MSILSSVSLPNPWLSIQPGSKPYYALPDLPAILEHNERLLSRYGPEDADTYQVRLDVFPEPFLGDPDAPILLLNLNPGYDDTGPVFHSRPAVIDLCVANLRHQPPAECPFYPLHPRYLLNGGSRWWSQRLKDWLEQYGKERVARAFFCIELFPYAARKYRPLLQLLPSQAYSIALAAAKIKSGSPVIVMRAETRWRKVLPELAEVQSYRLNSSQSVYLSRNNLPVDAVRLIERTMRDLR